MGHVTQPPVSIVALDFADAVRALEVVDELGDLCRFYKVGSELFTAVGPEIVARLRDAGCDVMLDLKFHDIPNTVAGAVRSARALGASIVTVHASGGDAMLRAAAEAAGSSCQVFAVTVLTSLDARAAATSWGRDAIDVPAEVVRLARLAAGAGAAGVVASGSDVESVKSALGADFKVLVPGIRLAGDAAADQSRIVTPMEARAAGADYVVLGRTVTGAGDRAAAMERALGELGC